MRIPQENENQERSADHQSPSPNRSQKTLRLRSKGFPKAARILTRPDFQRVGKEGQKKSGQFVSLGCRQGQGKYPRLGIVVSRRYGKAHLRNRFKRLVREAFRECQNELAPGLDVVVSPRPHPGPLTKQSVIEDLLRYAECRAKKSS